MRKLIIAAFVTVFVLVVLYFLIFSSRQDELSLLDELPRASIFYSGLTLNMDGAPQETFWLRDGFGYSIDNQNAKDGRGRQIQTSFSLVFDRWQARGISMDLGIFLAPGCQNLILKLNGKQVISKEVGAGYQQLVFDLPDDALVAGENLALLEITGIGDLNALVDYVRWHIGSHLDLGKPEVDQRLLDGKKVSVIGSSAPWEMNFYLAAPLHSHLNLTLGHDGEESTSPPGRLRIWYQGYASGGRLLWEGDYPAKGTKNLDLELGNFQDEIVLLSFYITPKSEGADWYFIAAPHLSFPEKPQAPNPGPPLVMSKESPRTIVLIFEDAMRQDMLSTYGNTIVQTPNLEKIAKSGVVFENCYAPSNWTHPSFSSMFTGLPFTQNGAIGKKAIMVADVPTMAGILSQNGWNTVFFTSNGLTSPPQGVPRGFKRIYTLHDLVLNQDKFTIEDYLPWLKDYLTSLSPQSDAFITLHLMDTHQPIIVPSRYEDKYIKVYDQIIKVMPWLGRTFEEFNVDEIKWVMPLYAVENYFDDILPSILEIIGKYRDLKNTVFILLSDHGEEIYDHGSVDHGTTLYEELIHVPLIIWGTGVVPARSNQYVNGIDLMPTILDMAGIETPKGIEGISFADKLNGDETTQSRPIYSAMQRGEHFLKCVVFEPWKLIYNDNLPELYNLAEDPKEIRNQIASNPITFGYMRGMLHEWWLDIFAHGVRENKNQLSLSERDIEVLKGLGYISK